MFGRPITAARAVIADPASPPGRRTHPRADLDHPRDLPQLACHTSPLDDIHTPRPPNKLSGKAIAGPLGPGNQRPLTRRPRTDRMGNIPPAMGATAPHHHRTPPTLRADPCHPPGPPTRGAAPTGPHPHSATSSPQPDPATSRARPIGTTGHPNGTSRHPLYQGSIAARPAVARPRAARTTPRRPHRNHRDLRKYHLPDHNRILV